jgi:hypothetical protein
MRVFLLSAALFAFFGTGVTAIGSGGGKLAKLVANHILGYIYRHMFPAVMHGKGVSDKIGEDCGGSAPRAQHFLFASGIHLLNPVKKAGLNERPFFDTSAHALCLLISARGV